MRLQAPGLSAMQSIGPAIQQAAADPTNAASMLMAAAAVFAGDSATPPSSKNVATAVNQFVADPGRHVPRQARCPVPRHTCPRVSTRPTPSDLCRMPRRSRRLRLRKRVPAPAPAPAPAPDRRGGPGAPAARTRVRSGRPDDAGLHVSVDQQRVLAGRRQRAGDRDLGRGSGDDPGTRAGGRPDGLRVHRDRHARTGRRAEAAAERHVGQPDHRQVGQRHAQAAADINPDGPTTLSAIVDTGSGSIMSTIFGQVTTTEKQCQFMPTIGSTVVP